ncbi:hypothetical protein PFICI_12492 [Pestalotiopsis fici W106-1]|uniref:Uncharacterized protein n=1 Tax=Pestalotiopsis fici (strain W106-1 / CGMCC3.15140) TaxID=1229662 RepID=W3WNW2_PESFW|nr:uncharacterized protein PFICI_12492 [Pestalotiopsis fici W106-1]ETS75548.1 hypothetical protein PFICI_12492 [Pestalotiopsis fici W106-1]
MGRSNRKHSTEGWVSSRALRPAKRLRLPSLDEGTRRNIDFEPPFAIAAGGPGSKQTDAEWGQAPLLPSVQPNDHDLICYGALFEVQAAIDLPNGIAHCRSLIQNSESTQQYPIDIQDSNCHLLSTLYGKFAIIDSQTATFICALHNIPHIRFLAVVNSNKLRQMKLSKKRLCIVPLSINIYGQYKDGETVGDLLGTIGAFLQHPAFLESGIEYYNPQLYYPDGKLESLTHLVGLSDCDIAANLLSEDVEAVLASLDDYGTGSIDSIVNLTQISTELRRHQKLALDFMRRHEDFNEVQAIHRDLSHLIGLPNSEKIPVSCTGGILADVMGLGKTLSVLALILSSLQNASNYQSCLDVTPQERRNTAGTRTRASLIVVTSAQVLDTWLTEIQNHLQPTALKVLIFHGDKRPRAKDLVANHDVVFTTYATLVADCRSAKILQSMTWFRVVLDEAHWIRNQASQQFKAIIKVPSQRRWCLTGTPIQNRIDDLVSLLRFLQFEPLCNKATFEKYILEPLSKETPERTRALHVLLRGLCLRRDESHLNLPSPTYQTLEVSFDPKERELYDGVLYACQRDLDDVVSGQSKSKKYSVLFAAMTKLRRLCNHGTMQSVEAGSSSSSTTLRFLEPGCDYCQGNHEESLAAWNKETACPHCGRSLQQVQNLGLLTPERDASRTPTPGDIQIQLNGDRSPRSQLAHNGSSSKLLRVVDNLAQTSNQGKSLVFSFWTSTLDLLKHMLINANIPCLMIDGRVPYAERPRILEQFRNDPNVPILLMTIQTGAVGLNLTAANFIHIVEPQWNPSTEEQAIGRAVRMGQTRTVTVFRYVVESSIEQNIQTLQKKKKNLAKFTLDGSGTESGSLEDFKFMLDM